MKRIILIGYMGAGKTTLGKALAQATDLQFIDLDWYIEERFHTSIQQIFADKGESGFRDIERRMLHEVAEFEDVIISCGGGTPCYFDNIDYMNQQGDTIYLKATPETLKAHLLMGKNKRPLIQGKSPEELIGFISESLSKRTMFYEKAHHIIDVNVLDSFDKIDQIVDTIIETGGLQGSKEASRE